MSETFRPAEWARFADRPPSELAPRRRLANLWEEVGDPAGPALRQLCDVLDGRIEPEAVDARPSALHRAALALFPPYRPPSALRRAARALFPPFHRPDHFAPVPEPLYPVWRAAWRRVALATGPTDEEAARRAIDAAYASALIWRVPGRRG